MQISKVNQQTEYHCEQYGVDERIYESIVKFDKAARCV